MSASGGDVSIQAVTPSPVYGSYTGDGVHDVVSAFDTDFVRRVQELDRHGCGLCGCMECVHVYVLCGASRCARTWGLMCWGRVLYPPLTWVQHPL